MVDRLCPRRRRGPRRARRSDRTASRRCCSRRGRHRERTTRLAAAHGRNRQTTAAPNPHGEARCAHRPRRRREGPAHHDPPGWANGDAICLPSAAGGRHCRAEPAVRTKSNEGIDVDFLLTGTVMARRAVYSLHKTSTRSCPGTPPSSATARCMPRRAARLAPRCRVQKRAAAAGATRRSWRRSFALPATYAYRAEQDVEVDLVRCLARRSRPPAPLQYRSSDLGVRPLRRASPRRPPCLLRAQARGCRHTAAARPRHRARVLSIVQRERPRNTRLSNSALAERRLVRAVDHSLRGRRRLRGDRSKGGAGRGVGAARARAGTGGDATSRLSHSLVHERRRRHTRATRPDCSASCADIWSPMRHISIAWTFPGADEALMPPAPGSSQLDLRLRRSPVRRSP